MSGKSGAKELRSMIDFAIPSQINTTQNSSLFHFFLKERAIPFRNLFTDCRLLPYKYPHQNKTAPFHPESGIEKRRLILFEV